MRYWVYMLECSDGRYYVGSYRGEDIDDRVGEHNEGKYRDAWTYSRRPVLLVWSQEFQLALQAIAVERQLKGWRRKEGSRHPRRLVRAARAGQVVLQLWHALSFDKLRMRLGGRRTIPITAAQ